MLKIVVLQEGRPVHAGELRALIGMDQDAVLRLSTPHRHQQGFVVARCTIERLMADLGRQGAIRGKAIRTTVQDKAARSDMTVREALGSLVSHEIARRDERRIETATNLTQFPDTNYVLRGGPAW